MQAHRHFRSQRGMTLIESLVALGIAGILTFILVSLVMTAIKGHVTILQNADFDSLKMEIQRVFKSEQLCGKAFRDIHNNIATFSPAQSNLDHIYNDDLKRILVQKGTRLGNNNLSTLDLRFEYQKTPAGINVPTEIDTLQKQTTHWVNLIVEADRAGGYGGYLSNVLSPFNFGLITDNETNQIVGCVLTSAQQMRVFNFIWIAENQDCEATKGYIDAQLEDDADDAADLNEDHSGGGAKRKLCAFGFDVAEDIGWFLKRCPAGYKFTGVVDDSDGGHALDEDSESGATTFWCMRGLSSVEWTGTCRPGYTFAQVTDDGDSVHQTWEDESESGGFKFCVR